MVNSEGLNIGPVPLKKKKKNLATSLKQDTLAKTALQDRLKQFRDTSLGQECRAYNYSNYNDVTNI